MDKVSLTRLAIMIKYTAGELKNFRGNCPLEKERRWAMLSIQIIGFQRWMLMMVTRLRCQQSAVVDILGILLSVDVFLLVVDIFARLSDGYVFVAYAGGGLDVFLQVEDELLVVVRWAS